jgi:uncharacterized protein DUF4331
MSLTALPRSVRRLLLGPAAVAAAILLTACDDSNAAAPLPLPQRTFNQVQRLGNPLVSEVFLAKRDHGFHGSSGPSIDVAALTPIVRGFVDNVAGRDTTVGKTIAAVLLPDELLVQSDKATSSAGWLTWALANGWGGRRLTDDVVTAGLQAVFGALLDPNNTTPALADDHVDANDVAFSATFPYLAAAH